MFRLLGRGVTSDHQLNIVGKRLFGKSWLGVFSSDVLPNQLMKNVKPGKNYGIINVDGRNEPGSHWLSIFIDTTVENAKWHIYDSYARHSKRLIPKFIKTIGFKYIDMNTKSDQSETEESCGARSMAVLLHIKRHGIQSATGI
jgi:hypothetical protein